MEEKKRLTATKAAIAKFREEHPVTRDSCDKGQCLSLVTLCLSPVTLCPLSRYSWFINSLMVITASFGQGMFFSTSKCLSLVTIYSALAAIAQSNMFFAPLFDSVIVNGTIIP